VEKDQLKQGLGKRKESRAVEEWANEWKEKQQLDGFRFDNARRTSRKENHP